MYFRNCRSKRDFELNNWVNISNITSPARVTDVKPSELSVYPVGMLHCKPAWLEGFQSFISESKQSNAVVSYLLEIQ